MDATEPAAEQGSMRPEGWQFSPLAVFAREVTAVLFGPVLSYVVRGPEVVGARHLDELEGPALICPTHASHFDVSVLRLAVGRRHRRHLAAAAAADYFMASRWRWFFAAWLGSFPFNRLGRGDDSFKTASALLAAGWNVLVFPEGTRSPTGEIGRFLPGIGLLATRTGRQVLPVRIVGTAAVLPKGDHWPCRSPVEVRFGAPLRANPGEDSRSVTGRLEAAVCAL